MNLRTNQEHNMKVRLIHKHTNASVLSVAHHRAPVLYSSHVPPPPRISSKEKASSDDKINEQLKGKCTRAYSLTQLQRQIPYQRF